MATRVDSLEAYANAHAALVTALRESLAVLQDADYSEDPGSPYQQAQLQSQKITRDMQTLAAAGLQQVDEAIAQSGQIEALTDAAAQAKREAELIGEAADKIAQIAKVVDAATGIVTKLSGLPFL